MIPRHIIDEIRDRTDIVDLIGSFITLKRAGSNYRALCPFHKEKTPSFNVNPERQIYHCFGCGKGGSVYQFLMDYEGLDFLSAVKVLADRANVSLVFEDGTRPSDSTGKKTRLYKINEEAAHLFYRILQEKDEAQPARDYLATRQLDESIVKTFQFGYAPDRWDLLERWAKQQNIPLEDIEAAGLIKKSDKENAGDNYYDRFRDRIMIPIRDELGRVIAFTGRILKKDDRAAKYVNSPETIIFHKSRVLFALDQARRAITEKKYAILCEGQIDAIRCHQAGFTNTIASQGTALTEQHARIIKRYCDEVILVLDPDLAGQNAAMRSYEIFLAAELSVRVAQLPEGQDPDTLICAHGPDAFAAIINEAIPALDYEIKILKQREGSDSDAGLMRIMKTVIQTIQHASGSVLRERLINRAAELLEVSPAALREDFRKTKPIRPPPSEKERYLTQRKAANARKRPPEELALAELLLAHHPDICAMIEEYLPLDMMTDAICRDIVEQCIEQQDSGKPPVIDMTDEEKDEVVRLSAGLQMSPDKLIGEDSSPVRVVQHCILGIYKRSFEKKKKDIYRQLDTAPSEEQEFLAMQASQLTEDLANIRKGWEYAQNIFQH
jgi:DNA primase